MSKRNISRPISLRQDLVPTPHIVPPVEFQSSNHVDEDVYKKLDTYKTIPLQAHHQSPEHTDEAVYRADFQFEGAHATAQFLVSEHADDDMHRNRFSYKNVLSPPHTGRLELLVEDMPGRHVPFTPMDLLTPVETPQQTFRRVNSCSPILEESKSRSSSMSPQPMNRESSRFRSQPLALSRDNEIDSTSKALPDLPPAENLPLSDAAVVDGRSRYRTFSENKLSQAVEETVLLPPTRLRHQNTPSLDAKSMARDNIALPPISNFHQLHSINRQFLSMTSVYEGNPSPRNRTGYSVTVSAGSTPFLRRRSSRLSHRSRDSAKTWEPQPEDPFSPVDIISPLTNGENVGHLAYLPRYTNNFAGFCKSTPPSPMRKRP